MGNTNNKKSNKTPRFIYLEEVYIIIDLKKEKYRCDANWAICTDLSQEVFIRTYGDKLVGLSEPFMWVSYEIGETIMKSVRDLDRGTQFSRRYMDAYDINDVASTSFHHELSVSDYPTEKDTEDYYRERKKLKLKLTSEALSKLTDKQRVALLESLLNKKTHLEISKEERVQRQVICKRIEAAKKKFDKVFDEFLKSRNFLG